MLKDAEYFWIRYATLTKWRWKSNMQRYTNNHAVVNTYQFMPNMIDFDD